MTERMNTAISSKRICGNKVNNIPKTPLIAKLSKYKAQEKPICNPLVKRIKLITGIPKIDNPKIKIINNNKQFEIKLVWIYSELFM